MLQAERRRIKEQQRQIFRDKDGRILRPDNWNELRPKQLQDKVVEYRKRLLLVYKESSNFPLAKLSWKDRLLKYLLEHLWQI